ncbi:hypothetical protein [Streptococcus hyovaginalis]|nr:hypothetical protein [Streptococcus hyovaginalis]MDY4511544.1 hypothetical protein [Streptococcus hyovaginalis]
MKLRYEDKISIDELFEAFDITRSLSHSGCPYGNAIAFTGALNTRLS